MREEIIKVLNEYGILPKGKMLNKGDYVKIGDILFRCYNGKERLCTTVDVLNEDIVQESSENKINKKCVKQNHVMFNSNIIDGEYGTSVIRKLLQGFENKFLDTSKLNKVYGKDYVRLLKKEEVEGLDREFHDVSLWYWTMTFRNYDSDNWAHVFFVYGSGAPGQLTNSGVGVTGSDSAAVRPVISLKSNIQLSGEGTKEKPYEIIE